MNLARIATFVAVLWFSTAERVWPQVVINEIQSSNFSTFQDESGKYEDWVELYNSGSTFVNLSGYGLSDNPAKPFKFTFPPYLLAAGKHLVVIANDTNQAASGAHWETAVHAGDIWKYRANTTAPPDTNWRNLSFNDSGWSSGKGGIGFGDGDDSTIVPNCISVYMRRTFSISDTSRIADAILNVDFDDGFVAFVNGVEIARVNVGTPGIRPAWNATTYANYEAVMYQGMDPDSFHFSKEFIHSLLRNGTNVLALEVHNLNSSSSDLSCIPFLSFKIKDSGTMFSPVPSWFIKAPHTKDFFHAAFKISRSGETLYLTQPGGTTADQIAVPTLEFDHSFGRSTDGGTTWNYFETPTPDTTNNISASKSGYATIPVFSLQGGFYTGSQLLTLTTSFPGGIIRYTTNGNTPTSGSSLYTGPISINATTSIRARVFATESMPSPTVTNTYFINLNCKLPVYSLTLDSADLWDYNKGIFVLGPNASTIPPYYGANYWQDWEKYMSLEFFDKQKNRAFKFNAGLSVTGGWSRRAGQKSLEINLGDKYGLSRIEYPMIPDKKWITKWDDFLLHTTGNDRGYAHMRDPVMERLMKGTHSDYTAYEPCLLYINGVNWGVYYTKENDDAHFVEYNYGFEKDEIDFLKERSEEHPDMIVRQGDELAFKRMHDYAMTNAPAGPDFYAVMDSMIEIVNQVDYFAAETYYPNDDWMGGSNNNLKMWRPRDSNGRFRYVLYDLDFGFGMYGAVDFDMLATAMNPSPHNFNSDIFQRLLGNPKYKNYFINRYADLINTNWQPANVLTIVNNFKDSMRYDMHFQFSKWGNGDTNTWKANINNVINFSAARPTYVRNQIQSHMGMAGQVTLTLQASPAGSGRIQISTVIPAGLPWSGVYFNGNPVTVTAIPNPGFTFNHWGSNAAFAAPDSGRAATRNFTTSETITAYFTGSAIAPQLTVSEINYHSDSASNAGDWFELHNLANIPLDISGWKVRDDNDHHEYVFPVTTEIPANGYLVVSENLTKFNSQHPGVTNVTGETGFNLSDGGDQIRLFTSNDSLLLSLTYDDQDPWPAGADGDGYTLELLSEAGNLSDGNNWFQGCLGGSPGGPYTAPLAQVTASGATTFCAYDSLTLTATPTQGNTYQWLINDTAIAGATASSFRPLQSGTYRVVVARNGCSATSAEIPVTLIPASSDPVPVSGYHCGPGNVTLHASAGDTIRWYNTPGGSMLGTGASFVTPSISTTTTYYARAGTACPGNYIPVQAIISTTAPPPSVSSQSRCGSGAVTFQATASDTVFWYDAPDGNLLFTGASFTTPVISETTTYYAVAGSTCPGSPVSVNAIINALPADPVAATQSRCGSGSLTLTATASDTIRWYGAPNGIVLGTGPDWVTPAISQTTTYYVQSGGICKSNFVPVNAVINPVSADPLVSDASRCSEGNLSLTATSADPVGWYDNPSGNLLYTGPVFLTPVIAETMVYYARSESGCPGSFVPVQAIISEVTAAPVIADQQRCGNGAVTFTAVATDTVRWFDAPGGSLLFTGNSYTTQSLTGNTNFYAVSGSECPSPVTEAHAILNPVAEDPSVTGAERCGPGSLQLSAASTEAVNWFDAPNGAVLYSGYDFVTPFQSQNTTFYVRAGVLCPGSFVPVLAVVHAIEPDPVCAGQSACGPGSISFTAVSSGLVHWYDAPNGTILSLNEEFTTPVISQSATYFIRTEGTCPGNFIPVEATILPLPADPVVGGAARCGPGSVTLVASSPDVLSWYDLPYGSQIGSGASFNTPLLNSNMTYYVRAEGSCNGNYVPVTATILQVPGVPAATDQARCGPGSVTLNATGSDTIRWYDAAGLNLLGEGSVFPTPLLQQTALYKLRSENQCASAFVDVNAIVNALPVDPVTVSANRCGEGSVVVSAISADSLGWYASPNGIVLGTGATFQTPVVDTTTIFYVVASNGCPGNFIPVSAVILDLPELNLGNDTIIETGTSLTLNAGPGFQSYHWSTGVTTQSVVVNSTGNFWVTVADSNGCTATDTIQVLVTVNVQPYVMRDGILIYPNPTQSSLSVSFTNMQHEDIFLRLIDHSGKLVWSDYSTDENRVLRTIDLRDFARGLYILQIATPAQKNEFKIILN